VKKSRPLRKYERINPIKYKTTDAQRAASADRYQRKRQELLEYWRNLPRSKREERNLRSKEWKQRNQARVKSPEYKIVRIVLGRIHESGFQPLGSAEELLGCSVVNFIERIERKFGSEMTWENHGILWEFDHIKPIEAFDLSTLWGQKRAQHYSNWRPLHRLDHSIKSAREQLRR
jgi:hypothetical protein